MESVARRFLPSSPRVRIVVQGVLGGLALATCLTVWLNAGRRERSPSTNLAPVARADVASLRAATPAAPADRCPEGMREAAGVCVDRYEAHLVVPTQDAGFAPHPFYQRPPASVRYEARSQAGATPQAYISRIEAALACEHAGKRLCTARE